MASSNATSEPTGATQSALGVDMKLEVVTLPVSDVDRAKSFYEGLGWRLDADIVAGGQFRVVQLTPPIRSARLRSGPGSPPPSPAPFSVWSSPSRTSRWPARTS